MNKRTKVGAGDDKLQDSTRVERLLQQLGAKEFSTLTNEARWELVRKSLILLLSVTLKRILA